MKRLFKDYLEKSSAEVRVNADLKRQLSNRLFSQYSPKKPFWTLTKAIFTAPLVAAFAIIFLLSSNEPVLQHVLSPQEALAQALENTFNLETFETTFGMPDDDKLHHRLITRVYLGMPEDGRGTPMNEEKITETVDLWFDGENVREDHHYYASQASESFSVMANVENDVVCRKGKEFTESGCDALSALQNEMRRELNSNDSGFFPQFEEAVLAGIEDITIELGKGKHDISFLTFSTQDPLPVSLNQMRVGGNPSKWFFAGPIYSDLYHTDDFQSENEFFNHEEDGKYWHRKGIIIYDEEVIYLQILKIKELYPLETNVSMTEEEHIEAWEEMEKEYVSENVAQASMIYKIDIKNESITPLSLEALQVELDLPKNHSVVQMIKEELRSSTLRTALHIINHPEEFEDPLKAYSTSKNNQHVFALQYILSNPTAMNLSFDSEGSYQIELYMDEGQTKFLGYTIVQGAEEIESLWLEDQILSENEQEKIFSQSEWKNVWP